MIQNVTEILDRANLVEVIERVAHVTWKRSGTNMVCNSPFAEEKTASFTVSTSKGIWKCFSSGKGGKSAASFIMELKGCTFVEAMEQIAEITGDVIQYDNTMSREEYIKKQKAERSAKEIMIAAIKKAYDYYNSKSTFPENESGLIELAGKTYSPAMVAKWGLIVTGDAQLLTKASSTWAERSALIDAGILATSKHSDGYYDFFNGRVLFPLYNRDYQVIGFNGRILVPSDKKPKYINSPETILYSKSAHVYGEVQNWKNIRDKKMAYLVEGPTDVIMMDQYGINNALCSSGTALTYDQAVKIAEVADQVILCYDNDANGAGHKATIKAVGILVAAQLDAKVKILPKKTDPDTGEPTSEGYDPAEYISEFGMDAFRDLPVVDGIEHVVSQEVPDGKASNQHQKARAHIKAVDLIANIDNQNVRDQYCQTISKIIDVTPAMLKTAVKEQIKDRTEVKSKLTKEQETQKTIWGVYIDNNRYHDYNGNEISNFIVKPLFLVSYNGSATRVFEIINKYGHSKVINMNSDDFITMMGFRRATEMLGSFIFKGNDAQFIKIREWVYNDMKEVQPIEILGYQPRTGVYAWANGITIPGTTQVMEVDEYGIVEYEHDGKKVNFFLPAESKVNVKHDEDNDKELESNFKWLPVPSGSNAPRDLKGWAAGFAKVFGRNAAVGLCYICAAVHRDLLHSRYDMFPHLNLFGPAGSGKTFMAQIITAGWGKPMRAVHLVSSSPVAFYRRIAQTRNSIIWYEEYSEKVTPEKQEALKNFADGFGRVTGQMTNNNKTKSTPVLNACIISGQILPSHDPALLERCVTLFFDKFYGDKKSAMYGEQFKSWSNDGLFAYVAAEIYSHREYVKENFADMMEQVRDTIRGLYTPTTQPSDRVLNNFSMIASVYLLIAKKVDMPFKLSDIIDTMVERINDQSRAVEGADELSGFWMVIEYLITKGKEVNGQGLGPDHYAVEYHKSVTIKVSEAETKSVEWEQEQKLMFIRLNHAHSLYTREGKTMVSRVVEKGTLLHYMKQHRSYVGEMKAKKINDKPQRCLVFNLEHLTNFEFDCTNFKTQENQSTKTVVETGSEGMTFNNPAVTGEIPF
jgi:DNA primase catalytic core